MTGSLHPAGGLTDKLAGLMKETHQLKYTVTVDVPVRPREELRRACEPADDLERELFPPALPPGDLLHEHGLD